MFSLYECSSILFRGRCYKLIHDFVPTKMRKGIVADLLSVRGAIFAILRDFGLYITKVVQSVVGNHGDKPATMVQIRRCAFADNYA